VAQPDELNASIGAGTAATTANPGAIAASRPPGFARQVLNVAAKDLRIEWVSREIVLTMGFLAVLVVLIFAFAFVTPGGERLSAPITSGILWVALMFAGTVALARSFDRERDGEAIRALLLSPAPRGAIYLGKLIGVVALMLLVEAIELPLVGMFFSAAVSEHIGDMALLMVLGTVGYASVGVVFSAGLVRSKSRDALLSSLLFPLVLPVLIAGVRGTSLLLDPATADIGAMVFWTRFLALADIVFLVLGLWAFEPLVSAE
jgi:heme exporter protein CcmB